MKDVDEVPPKIGVNDICLFRKGSDIDLEAIFGGRIGTKRTNGIKTNPVYKDGHVLKKGTNSVGENDMGGIEIQVYNNIKKLAQENVANNENLKMKEQLDKDNLRSERDKVTVTNGDVCVGDIIIENGHRNPAFVSDTDSVTGDNEVLEHTIEYTGDGECGDNMAGSEWPDIDDIALPEIGSNQGKNDTTNTNDVVYEVIDYNRNNTKMKNEIDTSDIEIDISDKVNSEEFPKLVSGEDDAVQKNVLEIQTVVATVNENSEQVVNTEEENVQHIESKLENENEHLEMEKDDGALQNDSKKGNELCSENLEVNKRDSENEDLEKTIIQETKLNGSVHSNLCEDEIILEESVHEKEKSKKKNKKIKERKNSLPDHILNSLNMKPSKPILVPVVVDNSAPLMCRDNSNEQKTVKFSKDTVFNEHKPNKYKQERVNLRDIYNGKISSKEAVAKQNPVFVDEDNQGLTDDEKVEIFGQNGLNTPAYLKDYIMSQGNDKQTFQRTGLEADNDIESIGSEGAVNYDKLIKRTLAKKRNRILRLTCAVFTFLIVVGVVVVLVVFVGQKQS